MKLKWIIKGILMAALFLLAVPWLVMTLWNGLVPAIFSGPVISFWQAAGLFLLSRILLGGWGCKSGGNYQKWNKMKERWQEMTPEERARMKELWKNRCRKWDCSEPGQEKGTGN